VNLAARIGALSTLAALVLSACISPVPMTISESFSNPATDPSSATIHLPRSSATPSCTLIVATITDARTDPALLGNVAGRPVRGPTNANAWLHNVIEGLQTRGIDASFDVNPRAEAMPLVADLTLRLAWVSDLHTSKNATTLWHMTLRRGDRSLGAFDYRGADTSLNWSSGDGELQRMVDRALGRALDAMAADVHSACGAH
jgi:hypothetical protein